MSGHNEDQSVLNQIQKLVTEEHRLYTQGAGGASLGADREQLAKIQVELDQCWDLLRQRRARREFGENPNDAAARPTGEVEGYMQ